MYVCLCAEKINASDHYFYHIPCDNVYPKSVGINRYSLKKIVLNFSLEKKKNPR